MKEAFWQRKANTFNKSIDMEKPFLKNKSRKNPNFLILPIKPTFKHLKIRDIKIHNRCSYNIFKPNIPK